MLFSPAGHSDCIGRGFGKRKAAIETRSTVAKLSQKKPSKINPKKAAGGRATPDRPAAKAKSTAKVSAPARTIPARGESRGSNGKGARSGHDRPINPPMIVRETPVPGKPVKNQAGLKAKELEFFRDLLLAKRRELLGDV